MELLFCGSISGGLVSSLREAGHVVYDPPSVDWWQVMRAGKSPEDWADSFAHYVVMMKPDVVVLPKGMHGAWRVPDRSLWWARDRVKTMVFVCHDDPAVTPWLLATRLPRVFDLWLTSCPGISQLFDIGSVTPAKVIEWWLAWDQRIGAVPVEPDLVVDMAITGTPYFKTWDGHYQGGFGVPRRDYVYAALEAGLSVGLWGADTWLDAAEGGDPAFKDIYRGWLNHDQIHRVHRAAKTVLATQLVEGYRYSSGRIEFVGGAGGCLVHERRPGLEEEVGNSVAWFEPGNVSEAIATVKRLVDDPAERDRMRADLNAIVLQRHCWNHRATQLIDAIKEIGK